VQNRDGEREEILRRLNEYEETFGETRVRSTDPAEEERLRRIKGEIEYERDHDAAVAAVFPSHDLVLQLSQERVRKVLRPDRRARV
jgi:hypothetical protein